MNKLLIDLNQPYTLHEVEKSKKDDSGRRFYLLSQDDKNFWLKAQTKTESTLSYQQFQNEKKYYQKNHTFDVLLPYQYVLFKKLKKHMIGEVLITPYTYPLFKAQISIDQKILLALNVLENMHHEYYIHGDLKPSHFRIFRDRGVLIDFDETHQQKNIFAQPINGTPRYMAPELFHGNAKTIQSDLYALGIILYEWLKNERISIHSYSEWVNFHCQHNLFQDIEQIDVLKKYKVLLYGLLNKSTDQRFKNVSCAKKAFLLD